MKLLKKILTTISLVSMAAGVLILISAIFGNDKIFTGTWLKVLLSLGTIFISLALIVNSLGIIQKRRIIGFVSIGLLAALTVLLFIIYWAGIEFTNLFSQITSTIAVATIFFCIITSLVSKLNSRHKVLQGITYFLIFAVDVVITLGIFGVEVFAQNGVWQVFVVVCLVIFALLITLNTFGKKALVEDLKNEVKQQAQSQTETQSQGPVTFDGRPMVTIPLDEYNELKARIYDLERKLQEKDKE